MSTPAHSPGRDALRAGVRVSWTSVAWTLASSVAAVLVGLNDGSLVLLVFGLTGLLDAAGSLTLALHFRHAMRNDAISPNRERLALRLVSIGLLVIGGSTVVESTRRLVAGTGTHGSGAGTLIAAASAVVLTGLTLWKRAVARRVGSDALLADGWLSATGASLAGLVAVGTTIVSHTRLAWIDPAVAMIIALVAAASGVRTLRREEMLLLGPQRSPTDPVRDGYPTDRA